MSYLVRPQHFMEFIIFQLTSFRSLWNNAHETHQGKEAPDWPTLPFRVVTPSTELVMLHYS